MLLREQLTFSDAKCIVEAQETPDGKGKDLYLKGICIQGGVRNYNERVYPVHEIRNAVEQINKKIDEMNGVLGECDHPEELTINLDRVSHVITEMWMDGPNGLGKLKIIPTPMGNIVRTLIECNVKIGVSSRGMGNVDDHGNVSGFEIVTVDCVASPSAQNAVPKPVYESFNAKRGRIIGDLATVVRDDPKAEKYLRRELLEWINNLKA